MKKGIVLLFLFFVSFSGKAQIDAGITSAGVLDSNFFLKNGNGFTLKEQKPQDVKFKLYVYGRDVSEIILIKPNGEFYYKPSAFCDCKKCRNFKGMKLMPTGLPQK